MNVESHSQVGLLSTSVTLLGRILLLTVALLLVACGSISAPVEDNNQIQLPTDAEVEQYNASVDPDDRIVCRAETPVGTNIRRRVCRFVRDVEETSAFHRDQLRRVLR